VIDIKKTSLQQIKEKIVSLIIISSKHRRKYLKILKDGIVRNLKSMKGRQLNNQKKGTTRIPITSRVRQLFPVLPVAPIVLNNERGKDAVL
jgi:hypothetical protein